MKGIKNIIGLLILSQLGACAVMSKQECITADWRQVGYQVGVDGNDDISQAFNIREKTCAKHGAKANWRQFQQGHSDGRVEYCQLDNAVELGIRGHTSAIDRERCAERDYPGFREAFNVGYKLHTLRSDVYASNATLERLNSRVYKYEKEIRNINKDLDADELDESERKSLKHERRKLRTYIYDLENDIKHCNSRLRYHKSVAREYSNYVFQDYMFSLSDEFIDPRRQKAPVSTHKQSDFEDRIDELLK